MVSSFFEIALVKMSFCFCRGLMTTFSSLRTAFATASLMAVFVRGCDILTSVDDILLMNVSSVKQSASQFIIMLRVGRSISEIVPSSKSGSDVAEKCFFKSGDTPLEAPSCLRFLSVAVSVSIVLLSALDAIIQFFRD